jgi:hypothetical protein
MDLTNYINKNLSVDNTQKQEEKVAENLNKGIIKPLKKRFLLSA